MDLLNLIAVFIAIVPFAMANTSTAPMISPNYHLKVEVIAPKPNNHSHFNGQYLQGYHIGAGMSDVALTPSPNGAAVAYLNGSNQLFNFGTDFPWSFTVNFDVGYAGWGSMEINAGEGDVGDGAYFINKTGLQYRSDKNPKLDFFGGWRVCDWWHGVAQLFWKNSYYRYTNKAPANCADVRLRPIYIK